ncbi:MAG: type II toxin-antitoxin system prevent-host-death family antitoxin [Gemmatimonadota bacterium]|jgi:prevent-host-death family protein|nr:type II toxin-antitoxin system prevent-host-death family antitoxin [Gemmatimonadota bacterium]MDQ8168581.1 type II toxin-antitoxin system prevent-host-death family antitoxin [Gemmatimonadota bacterium]MDQ8172723.1 type II toxin-antitoxin system prevent-host-death family antitoxin [Gemmatimonadota bacterium]
MATEFISISVFKATCLAVLERVRNTGASVVVTRRGEPIAEIMPPSAATPHAEWIGALKGTARIVGDIVAPVVAADEWDALRP